MKEGFIDVVGYKVDKCLRALLELEDAGKITCFYTTPIQSLLERTFLRFYNEVDTDMTGFFEGLVSRLMDFSKTSFTAQRVMALVLSNMNVPVTSNLVRTWLKVGANLRLVLC